MRALDNARASRAVLAMLEGSEPMLQQVVDDVAAEMQDTGRAAPFHQLIAALAGNTAEVLAATMGQDRAVEFARQAILDNTQAAESGE